MPMTTTPDSHYAHRLAPIIVTGAPRSGTTMTMRVIESGGVVIGRHCPGFVGSLCEQSKLRDGVVKPMLREGGFDPLGQDPLPPLRWEPKSSGQWVARYRAAVEPVRLAAQGIMTPDRPWAVKGIKAAYAPGVLYSAFPRARYLFVHRPTDEHVDSLIRTGFMRAHGINREAWADYIAWHREAILRPLVALTGDRVTVVEPREGYDDPTYWQALFEWLELPVPPAKALAGAINRNLYRKAS